MESAQQHVRFWAYDVAHYFHVDPTSVLRTWSVGELVEATHALQAYEDIKAAQADRQEKQHNSFGRPALGAWH